MVQKKPAGALNYRDLSDVQKHKCNGVPYTSPDLPAIATGNSQLQ